jgi:hypothetical protein
MDVLKINILVTLCTDIALLLMMLFGLLSKHLYERSTFGLGRHLWKQVECYRFTLTVVFSIR